MTKTAALIPCYNDRKTRGRVNSRMFRKIGEQTCLVTVVSHYQNLLQIQEEKNA